MKNELQTLWPSLASFAALFKRLCSLSLISGVVVPVFKLRLELGIHQRAEHFAVVQ